MHRSKIFKFLLRIFKVALAISGVFLMVMGGIFINHLLGEGGGKRKLSYAAVFINNSPNKMEIVHVKIANHITLKPKRSISPLRSDVGKLPSVVYSGMINTLELTGEEKEFASIKIKLNNLITNETKEILGKIPVDVEYSSQCVIIIEIDSNADERITICPRGPKVLWLKAPA